MKILSQPMKFMRGLALAAAALLALAPTLSRLEASAFVAPGAEAMCTAEGLETLTSPVGNGIPAAPQTHDDCGYCALLESSRPALPALAMDVPTPTSTADGALRVLSPFLAKSNFPALGSRGPPAL